jgi:hypothetical protein
MRLGLLILLLVSCTKDNKLRLKDGATLSGLPACEADGGAGCIASDICATFNLMPAVGPVCIPYYSACDQVTCSDPFYCSPYQKGDAWFIDCVTDQ